MEDLEGESCCIFLFPMTLHTCEHKDGLHKMENSFTLFIAWREREAGGEGHLPFPGRQELSE